MASKRSARQVSKRKSIVDEEDSEVEKKADKKIRSCSKATCPAKAPICFARATATCCGNGYTSRWYHITAGEHFCNECFEHYYRSYKEGYEGYISWRRIWSQYGSTDNGVRSYMADQMLPYWVQCNLCEKWRSVFREKDVSPKFFKNYVCSIVLKNQSQEDACKSPEDCRVALAKEIYIWPIHISMNQYVKKAIYAPYVRNFVLDSVGISPSDTSVHKYQDGIVEVTPYLQPFQYDDDGMANVFPPDQLSEEEQLYFPEFTGVYLRYYLIIRNTLLVLWALNVKTVVTLERCMNYIAMRGLSRVWLTLHVTRILKYLTLKGYINCGLTTIPYSIGLNNDLNITQKHPVIVIGAGLSGLSAARQLSNFGVQVTVLEASDVCGGRAVDDTTCPFTSQSQIVTGCVNNPIIIMCKQAEVAVKELGESCVLLLETGEIIDEKIDKRIQFHFEAMLDINKQQQKEHDKDASLLDSFTQHHAEFKEESGIKFSKLEEQLLQFHVSNLEFACGSSLQTISAQYWDQSDDYPQFYGPPVIIQEDFNKVLNKLSSGIHIVNNCQVTGIDYSGEDILVKTQKEEFVASKVVVCVPLEVLKRGKIKFTPDLPTCKSISLASGNTEKVILQFEEAFWKEKVKGGSMFGRLSTDTRGLFDVFYDISQGTDYMLSTFIYGEAVAWMKEQSDTAIVEKCLQCLRSIFPQQTVTEPCKTYVTCWYKREHIEMSYCYTPINAGPDAFSNMEQEVVDKLYFAGEATNIQYPQTLTGAYLSGIREAEKIIRSVAEII